MSDDLTPYASEQLDELLSAEIDGELAAAARDLGVTVDEVTARLRATPGVDGRRAALAAARDLMAEPPALDELLAQRLRTKALRAAVNEHAARELDRRRRRRQLILGASGVAAAAIAVVALAGGLNSRGGGNDSASATRPEAPAPTAAASGSAAKSPAAGESVALGEFADKHALATQAISRSASYAAADAVAPGPTKRQVAAGAPSPSTTASPLLGAVTTQSGAKSATENGGAGGQSMDVSALCPTPAPVHAGDKLVLRATATLSGRPVIVFVFAGGGEHSVTIENTNCSVVNIQMLR